MNFIETFKTSNKSLMTKKLRTLLTMLGVIIGVFAVVMMVALGKGAQNYITDQFEALGSNLIFVSPGKAGFGRDPSERFSKNKLDEKHVDLIKLNAKEYVGEVSPYIASADNAKYKNKSFYASIVGCNEEAGKVFNYEMDKGRFFNIGEVKNKKKVAVIGQTIIKELFGGTAFLDKKIKINDESYTVIGSFKEKGQNFDDGIIIPYTSAKATFDVKQFSSIVLKAKDENNIPATIKQVELALLKDLKKDDFTVLSQTDILGSITSILQILTVGIGAIAGISLLVGGIGIMNIMLVSVTERTREIGLRKAVGATPYNIAIQFLVESVLISVGGGLIGLVLGYLGS
nr:ABC transporter permease [Patescibacteria group bacterium]